MEWYEWVFDGVGTTIIGVICSFIGYKAAIKKMSNQTQKAGDDSRQKQEMFMEDTGDYKNVQNCIRQNQKAGKNSEQVQIGRINNEK